MSYASWDQYMESLKKEPKYYVQNGNFSSIYST